VLALAAVVATFLVDVVAALCALGAFAVLMAYFGLYSRHHLVAAAPDEEFAALAKAEEELE
jgi:ethanolamine permease